jgi:hypothetical protein
MNKSAKRNQSQACVPKEPYLNRDRWKQVVGAIAAVMQSKQPE